MSSRRAAYEAVRERLEGGQTVVLDGGVGSELVRWGVRWRDHGLRTDKSPAMAATGLSQMAREV